MKPWNKPIRCSNLGEVRSLKAFDKRFNEDNRHYGVTNWMVGTCNFPWSPWVQIHFGYWSIQIKWYLIVIVMVLAAFGIGLAIS